MSEGTAREIVARAELRDQLGQAVRAEWVRYCLETGDTKPSHIAPWDELSDWDKEADRRIADAVLTEAGALAPAGLASDSFTERDLDTIGLAVWVTSTAMTERRFVGLDLIEKLHACGFAVVRVAPAADAATGEPS